jgi:hypothetical protein
MHKFQSFENKCYNKNYVVAFAFPVFYDTTKNEKSIFKTFIAGNKRLRV